MNYGIVIAIVLVILLLVGGIVWYKRSGAGSSYVEHRNMDIKGNVNDIWYRDNLTIEQAQAICQADANCVGLTYLRGSAWGKSGQPGLIPHSDPDIVSFVKK